ncbi:hypothetical protein [Legionella cherrii]|uniref:Transmembrane protein n=1 Tax=Legionella cherrii TaxID=28084 RepID=A0A0W0S7E7_9GAMM|nr:hypothetical protein [Legionella cherrii]KTC79049.1 transmembrane protein [Legionella cherrii]VEB36445.1 transmembrane protein [Legionella cherrii]
MHSKHHGHDQYTGYRGVGSQVTVDSHHHHQHNPSPSNPTVHVHTPVYPPISPVRVIPQTTVEIFPRRRGYSYPQSYSTGPGWGSGAFLILAFVVAPIFVLALILKLTLGAVGLAATSLTAAGVTGASAAGAMALSVGTLGTLGIGALAFYAILGFAYLSSSAKECYNSDKNVFEMIKSRVVNEDGLSFMGVIKSIGAVLWSPFLLIGGLAGQGSKFAAKLFPSKSSTATESEPWELKASPYSMLTSDEPANQSRPRSENQREPGNFGQVFSGASTFTDEESLFKSATSFPSSTYP